MISTSLRTFQHAAKEYMDKLPIILTRYGFAVAVVVPIEWAKGWDGNREKISKIKLKLVPPPSEQDSRTPSEILADEIADLQKKQESPIRSEEND